MFLSKVAIDWRWAKDPYQLHRALWQLFPDRPTAQRDFLFRVEEGGNSQQGIPVLLQSVSSPQQSQAAIVLASKSINYALPPGALLNFRLRANPVKTIKDSQGRTNRHGQIKSCRVPLVTEEECLAWLARKLASAACLRSARIIREPALRFDKKGVGGKIQPLCFEGELVVEQPANLHDLISQGIGPGKSMGCGLLSLARA
ncbi:type I-E CRISPR-associated protein Cas6/Cse3/CasE [Erwinia sp. OLTSP20]|uniref:type I-E CRISPR-associated protein Cas6/Cse3/CasE n=1 Tax=unclassified Erwinia TaxID=2622719 RepID=UPI000C18633B|nr:MULTISPECIES: type I-E CRISPR-associated protein Cas6/Cse3/CasE [unclassified Erwinia]PIJ49777.1 type I-E CRISPR-associated protein Cas6/Cse3/CasE [Erwinia sp. OAMSP11]PIJ70876.1 type I-E CRISPR-associated protein Cas6/Cse3/CasE [Erwinia sp. OLSSP12]PIJ80241.1 type I-E CRISPR-associated protein Cas6/Cse3/CasE [Erwinia sp. OLCASP19]PIJ82365.1 type I-E CRISPR-associated protein Cas6/Cse3/CasE [Erwinia sp. OLMTSP26]PIJ85051.1 type I-E CRISPR-associated protein Cas6/Cse3/CasE [Erwinia sp. OLMDS